MPDQSAIQSLLQGGTGIQTTAQSAVPSAVNNGNPGTAYNTPSTPSPIQPGASAVGAGVDAPFAPSSYIANILQAIHNFQPQMPQQGPPSGGLNSSIATILANMRNPRPGTLSTPTTTTTPPLGGASTGYRYGRIRDPEAGTNGDFRGFIENDASGNMMWSNFLAQGYQPGGIPNQSLAQQIDALVGSVTNSMFPSTPDSSSASPDGGSYTGSPTYIPGLSPGNWQQTPSDAVPSTGVSGIWNNITTGVNNAVDGYNNLNTTIGNIIRNLVGGGN